MTPPPFFNPQSHFAFVAALGHLVVTRDYETGAEHDLRYLCYCNKLAPVAALKAMKKPQLISLLRQADQRESINA